MKKLEADSLQVFVLRHPYDKWEDPLVQAMFAEIVQLKIRGYKAEYPNGVLPVDTSDFVGDHIGVCHVTNSGLRPVMAFKSVTLSVCRQHQLKFSALSLMEAAKAPLHAEKVQNLVARADADNTDLTYVGSWTIDPLFRENREIVKTLKDTLKGIFYHHHQEQKQTRIFAAATPRFHTERVLSTWGLEPLRDSGGQVLPNIQFQHLFQEPVQIMYMEAFTDESRKFADSFKKLWQDRIEIGANEGHTEENLKKAA